MARSDGVKAKPNVAALMHSYLHGAADERISALAALLELALRTEASEPETARRFLEDHAGAALVRVKGAWSVEWRTVGGFGFLTTRSGRKG